jgi:phosphoglycolate phosphatase
MHSHLDAVVFDLDGTLADTVLDLAAALNATLAELGLPAHASESVRNMVGGGLQKLLDRGLAAHGASLDPEARALAGTRMLGLYAAAPALQSKLYPGAGEAVEALRRDGAVIGICTNKPHDIAIDLLAALGMAESFDAIQGSEPGLPKKPHPESLLRGLAGLRAAPERTIMVGDSDADVEAARGAGLAGVVLLGHGYSRRPVSELGADAVIDGFADLPAALSRVARSSLTLK